jgi:hypothetical protein
MITKRCQLLAYGAAHDAGLRAKIQVQTLNSGETSKYNLNITNQVNTTSMKTQSKADSNTKKTMYTKATIFQENTPQIQDALQSERLYAPSESESNSSFASSYTCKMSANIPARPKGKDGLELDQFECPYCLTACNI